MYLNELFEHKITEGFYVDPSTAAITITFDPNNITKDEFNSMLRDVADWQNRGAISWMVNGTPVNDALSAANWMKAQIKPRIDAATNTKANQPKLRIDNPGGDWLQGKIDYAKEKGPDSFGRPYMSTVTGTFNGYVRIPVSILKNIPGARDEQQNVRQDDLDWLMNYMKTNDRLPPMSDDNDSEYAPFIMVGYDGTPWVNEGNHRIMAAVKLGWKSLPIELRYFDGGENVAGPLHPDKLKNMVTESLTEAYENVLKDWKGWWITEHGERIDVDPENDYHHWQAAEEHFAEYAEFDEYYDDDGIITEWGIDGYIEIAKDMGWLRVYDRPNEFGMEFNTLSPETKKYALRQFRDQRGKLEFYVNNEVFDDIRAAQRYIREL